MFFLVVDPAIQCNLPQLVDSSAPQRHPSLRSLLLCLARRLLNPKPPVPCLEIRPQIPSHNSRVEAYSAHRPQLNNRRLGRRQERVCLAKQQRHNPSNRADCSAQVRQQVVGYLDPRRIIHNSNRSRWVLCSVVAPPRNLSNGEVYSELQPTQQQHNRHKREAGSCRCCDAPDEIRDGY